MSVIVELSIFPMDKGISVGGCVARAVQIIEESGLAFALNPMGTCILHDTGGSRDLDLCTIAAALYDKGCLFEELQGPPAIIHAKAEDGIIRHVGLGQRPVVQALHLVLIPAYDGVVGHGIAPFVRLCSNR